MIGTIQASARPGWRFLVNYISRRMGETMGMKSNPLDGITFIFVRHAESENNQKLAEATAAAGSEHRADRSFYLDSPEAMVPLTEAGRHQAASKRGILRRIIDDANPAIKPVIFASSTHERAKQTKDELLSGLEGLQVHQVAVPQAVEKRFGEWDGLSHQERKTGSPLRYRAMRIFGKDFIGPPGGESGLDLFRRAEGGLENVANEARRHGADVVVVVTHRPIMGPLAYAAARRMPWGIPASLNDLGNVAMVMVRDGRITVVDGGFKSTPPKEQPSTIQSIVDRPAPTANTTLEPV